MSQEDFSCKRCGNCCLYASFNEVEEADVRLWEKGGRTDILEWVRPKPIGDGEYAYEVWIDPRTTKEVDGCPWLKKLPNTDQHICQIYDVRPTICRYFPASRKHAKEVGCKGFKKRNTFISS